MTMIQIEHLREQLRDTGGCALTGPDGKSLFLVLNRNLGIEKPGILIAYEGHGAYFFDLDRPLNQFRLVKHGFSLRIAPTLAELVNAILDPGEASPEQPPVKQLSHHKDTTDE